MCVRNLCSCDLLSFQDEGTGADNEDEDEEDADLYRDEDATPAKTLKRNIEEVEDDEDKGAKKVKA